MPVGLPAKTTYVNGDVFSASDINDTNGTLNLVGQTNNFYAGKNKIINGDFGIWQRGTSFTTTAYTADRFFLNAAVTSGLSVSRQTFTLGTAPVSGYEGQYFADIAGTITNASTGYILLVQRIENVRTLAGQTVTYSFWAKGSTSGTISTAISQAFGTGGSPSATVFVGNSSHSITTSWQRFTVTIALPSISGKTIGTNGDSQLQLSIVKNMGTLYSSDYGSANYTGTLSIWGVQLEAGSTATAFQTATGTIQGELSACQRYYYRATPGTTQGTYGIGTARSTTAGDVFIPFPVSMRVVPTVLDFANLAYQSGSLAAPRLTASGLVYNANNTTNNNALINGTVSSGFTSNQVIYLLNDNNSAGYIGFGAEI
jgi:hypothetical protein